MKIRNKIDKDFYYMYGKHPVLAALKNKARLIKKILCTNDIFDANKSLISEHAYEILSISALTKILGESASHQGIAAYVRSVFLNDISNIEYNKPTSRIAILDQITDSQNIGAIIRSAASFNIDAIILPDDNAPSENAGIAKSASGTLELVPVIRVTNLRWIIEYLKKQGFWIIGLDGTSGQALEKKMISPKLAIVMGSEDKGIRRLVKESCDHIVQIPISNKVESLNVSNAAAIAFYMLNNL